MRNGNCHEICEKCAQMYINMQRYKEHKQNTYEIPAHTTHNGGRPSAAPHKGGPAAFGGRPTFVGTIMGGLCMYFITFSKYVPLFDPIFDPSYAHQDAEAPTS